MCKKSRRLCQRSHRLCVAAGAVWPIGRPSWSPADGELTDSFIGSGRRQREEKIENYNIGVKSLMLCKVYNQPCGEVKNEMFYSRIERLNDGEDNDGHYQVFIALHFFHLWLGY